jgi:tetratricopeptide (TPR) repeat protein
MSSGVTRRRSPSIDSAAVSRSIYNPWITELARRYCPPTVDSTAVFDDGLSAYLASRFLISRYPGTSRKERFDAVSNALTFFPSGTLAAGHSDRSNTNSIISFRGRYLFSMMEYLLGQESLDRVIRKITAGPAEPPVTFERFAALCTEEYGTPLENFIDQWVRRSASPEFVMQWKNERTVRGLSVVKASIEQRGTIFSVPIPLAFTFGSRVLIRRVRMEQQKQEFTFTFPSPPTSVELDPELNILRWQLEFRISAHAKTALLYLTVNRDIVNAEREALYTQQLDPNNSTGSAPLALFILGNISAVNGNKEKAKEYFLQSASAGATEGSDTYRLLSLIRYGNLLESDGKRDEAVTYYQRAVSEGIKDPVINAAAVTEAEMFLRERFVSDERSWFFVP